MSFEELNDEEALSGMISDDSSHDILIKPKNKNKKQPKILKV